MRSTHVASAPFLVLFLFLFLMLLLPLSLCASALPPLTNTPPPRPMMRSTAALEAISPAALAQTTNGLSAADALNTASLLRALASEQATAPLAAPASSSLMATVSTGPLLNLNFASPGWQKIGFAALGQTSNDFWNISWSQDQDSAATPNLLWADSSPSGAGVLVDNGPGLWGNDTEDPMYRTYIYPWDAGHLYVTLTNLPAGTYDFYLYAHGGATEANGIFELWSGQTSFGLRATTIWGSAWNSTNWEEGQQYTVYRNVPVSSETPVVIDVFPNSTGYALVNGLQVVPSSAVPRDPPPLERLLNVNFASPGWLKTGFAAVGQTTNDFWNISWSQNVPAAAITNLLWADGASSAAGILVQNGPGLWGNDTDDPMYKTYIYPGSGQITLTLTNLPTAHYDFYLYGHAPADGGNGIFELVNDGVSQGIKATTMWGPVWNSLDWQESHQYVVFRDVAVSNNQPVVINVLPSASGYALVAGLQIALPLDRDGDQLPDWWELKYFGDLSQTAGGDYDGDNLDNLTEFRNRTGPNTIAFVVTCPNDHVNGNSISGAIELLNGHPARMKIIVTNFSDTGWVPFTPSFTAALPTTDGRHDVWIGLRGLPDDSGEIWMLTTITRDTQPPTIVITNPVAPTTSQPMIQLQGYSPEPLASLRYDVTNAAGCLTNEQGFVDHQVFDTSIHDFTTNFFHCFDIELTNGDNVITLRATDLAGNTTTTTLTYTLASDGTAPVITPRWPLNGMQLCGETYTVDGWLDDFTAAVSVSLVDGAGVTQVYPGAVERDGHFWTEEVPLSAGSNALTIKAVDAWNNETTQAFTVTGSQLGLTVQPIDENQLHQAGITVSGTAPAGYTVWVNGRSAQVTGTSWVAQDVPITPGGTAIFSVQAYPPGLDLDPTAALRVEPSVNKPPRLYVLKDWQNYHSHSHSRTDDTIISTGENHWFESDTTQRYNHTWNDEAAGDGSEGYTTDSSSWMGTPTHFYRNTTFTFPVSKWPNPLPGPMTMDENGYVTSGSYGPPFIEKEHCEYTYATNLQASYDVPDMGEHVDKQDSTHWSRSAQTTMKLYTGGKAVPGRVSLFAISASATEILDPAIAPFAAYGDTLRKRGIPSTEIQIGGRNLGSDGKLYLALRDNETLDVTPTTCRNFYTLEVTPQKYRLLIQANNYLLDPDRVRPGGNYIVGQHLTFSDTWSPALPAGTSKWPIQWVLQGNVFNAGTNIIPGGSFATSSDVYFLDRRSLTNETVANCWWASGGPSASTPATYNAVVGEGLTFPNGQYVAIAARGRFNMYRPEGKISPSTSRVGVYNGYLLFADAPYLDGITFSNTLTVPAGFSGAGEWVQVVTSTSRVLQDTLGVNHVLTPNGLSPYGDLPIPFRAFVGTNPVDSPSEPLRDGIARCTVTDNFEMWMMFRPTGGQWVPLRAVNWFWSGTATNGASGWRAESSDWSRNASDFSTESYPVWKSDVRNAEYVPPLP